MELPKTPSLRLDGKTALVTGASSGIGLACAVALAEAGAEVTAAARSEDKLDKLVEAAQEKRLKMQACALDVSDLDAVSEMLDKSTSFDILVNSAGMARHGPAAETRADDFDAGYGSESSRRLFFVTDGRQEDDCCRNGWVHYQYFLPDGTCRGD